MKKTVIALLSVAVLGTGGYFAYNAMTNSAKKQDVTQLKVDDSIVSMAFLNWSRPILFD